MIRERTRIEARYPAGPLLLFLLILLCADYLCVDLRYIHYIQFSQGITANSRWFWAIFGGLILLTLHCVKQIFFPRILFRADLSGVELNHRVWRPKIRLRWEDVHQITRGEVSLSTENGRSLTPAVRLLVKTNQNL